MSYSYIRVNKYTMTYNEIVAVFRTAANSVLGEGVGLFHYGLPSQHDEKYAEPMPQIRLDPLKDRPNYGSGTSRIEVTVGFLDQDYAGSSAEEQAEIVGRMQVLSDRFMALLSEHELFDELTPSRVPLYLYSTGLLTGVVLFFTLTVPHVVCY